LSLSFVRAVAGRLKKLKGKDAWKKRGAFRSLSFPFGQLGTARRPNPGFGSTRSAPVAEGQRGRQTARAENHFTT